MPGTCLDDEHRVGTPTRPNLVYSCLHHKYTFKYFDLFSANSLDVALSRMQHTVAVDGFYVYVVGGRSFRTSDGSYVGDPTFRYMDARTEVWGSVNLGSFCKKFYDSGVAEQSFFSHGALTGPRSVAIYRRFSCRCRVGLG